MGDIKLNANGLLTLPLAVRHQLGTGPLEALSNSPGHLLLGRPDSENPILLAGVLGEVSVPDLLSFFNMFRKTGILHFDFGSGSKTLFFQQGEIVFASSTFAKEDLGEILFSLGKVERDALQQARQLVSARVSLGKILVDKGAVSPKDLWLATRSQVEGIVYSLFAEQQGSFYFEARAIDQEQLLRLSMSTQNLIMEGLRRQDEEALFMRKIISLDYYPILTGSIPSDQSPGEAKLLKIIETESLTARELFRKAGLGEFEGIRTLFGLLEKRVFVMEDSPASEVEGELGQVLSAYNNLLKILSRRMKKETPDYSNHIAGYIKELPQPFSFVMRDVEQREDGTLDGHRIAANMSGLEEGDKVKLLADSLCELVFMVAMLVRSELEAEHARPLIARIQEVTTRVREMVGKAE